RDLQRGRERPAQAQARRGGRPPADHLRPDRRNPEGLELSSDPRSTVPPVNAGGVNWRRNLAALWFAEFTAIFGFSFAFPFLSIFLHHDLGVQSGRDLDLWTAASASASGLSMAIASPIWGVSLGGAFGPVIGGLAGSLFGLRLVFLGGGVLLLLSLIPVLVVVRESPMIPKLGPRVGTLGLVNEQPGLLRTLGALIGAQGL